MKKFLLFLVCIGFAGCHPRVPSTDTGKGYRILIIDKCQYIEYANINQGYLAHKGNCTNSIHIYKQ
mgnify:CR=1 FL=1